VETKAVSGSGGGGGGGGGGMNFVAGSTGLSCSGSGKEGVNGRGCCDTAEVDSEFVVGF